jgi:hypothetical protein
MYLFGIYGILVIIKEIKYEIENKGNDQVIILKIHYQILE